MKNKKLKNILLAVIVMGGVVLITFGIKVTENQKSKQDSENLHKTEVEAKKEENKLQKITDKEILEMYEKVENKIFELYKEGTMDIVKELIDNDEKGFSYESLNEEYMTREERDAVLDSFFTSEGSKNHKVYKEIDGKLKLRTYYDITNCYGYRVPLKVINKKILSDNEIEVKILIKKPGGHDDPVHAVSTFNLKLEGENIKFSTDLVNEKNSSLTEIVEHINKNREIMLEENILELVKEIEEIYSLYPDETDNPMNTINYLKENTNKSYEDIEFKKAEKLEEQGYKFYHNEFGDKSHQYFLQNAAVKMKDNSNIDAKVRFSGYGAYGFELDGELKKYSENEWIGIGRYVDGRVYVILEKKNNSIQVDHRVASTFFSDEAELSDEELLDRFDYNEVKNSLENNILNRVHLVDYKIIKEATIKYNSITEIIELIHQERIDEYNNSMK